MKVRQATGDDVAACVAVLAALPDHFTDSTHDELGRDFPTAQVWVADDGGDLVGFVLAVRRFERVAEIKYAGVLPTAQSSGIGRALVGHALAKLRRDGVLLVEVKTLDESCDYEPYVATRAFWHGCGFVKVDVIDPLPGWEAGNPAAILVAALDATAPGRSAGGDGG